MAEENKETMYLVRGSIRDQIVQLQKDFCAKCQKWSCAGCSIDCIPLEFKEVAQDTAIKANT